MSARTSTFLSSNSNKYRNFAIEFDLQAYKFGAVLQFKSLAIHNHSHIDTNTYTDDRPRHN